MTALVLVGACTREVLVPEGTPMAGFAARTSGTDGVHDPLTVRALAIEQLVLVTVDVCGLHEDTCALIQARLGLPAQHVVVTATHTHAGPCVMPGRLGGADPVTLGRVVEAAVEAATVARDTQVPCALEWVEVQGAAAAKNRRDPSRVVDPPLAVLSARTPGGRLVARLATYSCHPVVLGADNHRVSADYPARLRDRLEAEAPGCVALFMAGTPGDLNTGHSAEASFHTAATSTRTIAEARRIGDHLADCVLHQPVVQLDLTGGTRAARQQLDLRLESLDAQSPSRLARQWALEIDDPATDSGRRALLEVWRRWALQRGADDRMSWAASVTTWAVGRLRLVFLPGEPFEATGRSIRAAWPGPAVVSGYANGCPGYIPTADEYELGGYEVLDAHRYYGMPAPFARGSAEMLEAVAVSMLERLAE